jgi:hypothetical protein
VEPTLAQGQQSVKGGMMDTIKEIKQVIYTHGGSRIYSGERDLLVDTYADREFAEYIKECVDKYFKDRE